MPRIYLVEDSPIVLERLEKLLGSMQNARIVGHAATADAAIAGILAARPDVAFVDLKLAQGSGFEVLRAVHELDPRIDVYMLSNFASEPYRRHAERLGARDFFDKSKDFERVRDIVARRAAEG